MSTVATNNPEMHAALWRLGFFSPRQQMTSSVTKDTLEELQVLNDKEVDSMCKVVKNPVGPSMQQALQCP